MNPIAVIPARRGSKRIPNKNIKNFHGKPIIIYAIENAMNSGLFENVYVSTDDKEIAEIAKAHGAQVPWLRSNKLSDDFSSTIDVMEDFLTKLSNETLIPDYICCIYPCTPLLNESYLKQGLDLISTNKWDYVISALKSQLNPNRVFQVGPEGKLIIEKTAKFDLRTQDFNDYFSDAGQFYWGDKFSWIERKPIFNSKSTVIVFPPNSTIDIDTIDQWEFAENLYMYRKEG
jgi:pseudaminic acid cytidylyltransferase